MTNAELDAAIRQAFAEARVSWPSPPGPVPLNTLINEQNAFHEEVPSLTRAKAAERVGSVNLDDPRFAADQTPLAGFIFAAAGTGRIFVTADDILTRRRFTAAHEFGHFLLHFDRGRTPEPQRTDDALGEIEQGESGDDFESLARREREANRFAARLLMPTPVVRGLLAECGPNAPQSYLVRRVATELLVSEEAVRWRLKELPSEPACEEG